MASRQGELKKVAAPTNRIRLPIVLVAALCLLGVGVTVGVLVVPVSPPSGIAPASPSLTAPTATQSFSDSSNLNLSVVSSASRTISVAVSGFVTSVGCVSGAQAVSGNSGVSVNDLPLIYLATSEPLWRDLGPGDRGADVLAFQKELARLGYAAPLTGQFGRATLTAATNLARHDGSDTSAWKGVVPRSQFVWLPAPGVITVSCAVQVGAEVSDGSAIASLPEGIASAMVQNIPANGAPGPRVIRLGALTVPVSTAGTIDDSADLSRLAASPAYAAYLAAQSSASAPSGSAGASTSTAAALSVDYELAQPIQVTSVPAAALYRVSGNRACIFSSNRALPVTIVGSQLAKLLWSFRVARRSNASTSRLRKLPRAGDRTLRFPSVRGSSIPL